jgi:D-xylose 1-dehydrogenase (NADP+, D-xylono-1,5-lactone-forming)
VLGAAWIAGRAVLPAIASSTNGRMVALASRSRDRARQMLAPYSGAHAVESYEALLEMKDVDAVYVPLTNNLHREWTLRALAAGKHVLCEKPLAMNAAEAEEMASAATAAGRRLMEAFMYRFDPRTKAFVEGIQDPLHVQASFGFSLQGDNFRFDTALGGGALYDVGCYTIGIARWILGEPVEVLAHARMQNGIDMSTSALLVFDQGRTASVWASFESPEAQEVTVISRDGVDRLDRPFTSDRSGLSQRLMVESFADSVLKDKPVAIPPSESIANMRTLDRIRAAFSA